MPVFIRVTTECGGRGKVSGLYSVSSDLLLQGEGSSRSGLRQMPDCVTGGISTAFASMTSYSLVKYEVLQM